MSPFLTVMYLPVTDLLTTFWSICNQTRLLLPKKISLQDDSDSSTSDLSILFTLNIWSILWFQILNGQTSLQLLVLDKRSSKEICSKNPRISSTRVLTVLLTCQLTLIFLEFVLVHLDTRAKLTSCHFSLSDISTPPYFFTLFIMSFIFVISFLLISFIFTMIFLIIITPSISYSISNRMIFRTP